MCTMILAHCVSVSVSVKLYLFNTTIKLIRSNQSNRKGLKRINITIYIDDQIKLIMQSWVGAMAEAAKIKFERKQKMCLCVNISPTLDNWNGSSCILSQLLLKFHKRTNNKGQPRRTKQNVCKHTFQQGGKA